MKGKVIAVLKVTTVLLAGVLFCLGIFALNEIAFNGIILDWLQKIFINEYEHYNPTSNSVYFTSEFNFTLFKQMAMVVMVLNMVFWLCIIMAVVYYQKRKTKKRCISEIGGMIQASMLQESVPTLLKQEQYANIYAQITSVKSEMTRKEQELKAESTRKNDMIAYLAHDLKTPLTSVIGYLSLLDEAPDMPDAQKGKYVRVSLEKALRLEKLIQELFEITRYNLQQIQLEMETIPLPYMLVQLTDEFYPLLKAHGNTIEVNTPESLNIYADPVKLARVFNNLLKNAIAYSYPNTVIEVSAECTQTHVNISFSNHGRTIPQEKLQSIFEKFFRLDDARGSDTGGAGLGLAIAKEIITLHGGTITAVSEHESTVFTVTLPRP